MQQALELCPCTRGVLQCCGFFFSSSFFFFFWLTHSACFVARPCAHCRERRVWRRVHCRDCTDRIGRREADEGIRIGNCARNFRARSAAHLLNRQARKRASTPRCLRWRSLHDACDRLVHGRGTSTSFSARCTLSTRVRTLTLAACPLFNAIFSSASSFPPSIGFLLPPSRCGNLRHINIVTGIMISEGSLAGTAVQERD